MIRKFTTAFACSITGFATIGCEAGPAVDTVTLADPAADYAFVEHGAPAPSKVETVQMDSMYLPSVDPRNVCAVRCRAEAMATARDCLNEGASCPVDAVDVFEVCQAAECSSKPRELSMVAPARFHAAKATQPVAAELVPTAPTCHAACQAHDLDVYLTCVRERPNDGASCRDGIGRALEACVAGHCSAE